MARRFFQLHFASTIVLFISVALMLGWNVAVYSSVRPTFDDVMRNIGGVLFIIAIEAAFVLYPAVMFEAWQRRRETGRTLKLRRGTILLLSLGICLFVAGGGAFPFGFYFLHAAREAAMALSLNLYTWLIVLSVLAYVWEVVGAKQV